MPGSLRGWPRLSTAPRDARCRSGHPRRIVNHHQRRHNARVPERSASELQNRQISSSSSCPRQSSWSLLRRASQTCRKLRFPTRCRQLLANRILPYVGEMPLQAAVEEDLIDRAPPKIRGASTPEVVHRARRLRRPARGRAARATALRHRRCHRPDRRHPQGRQGRRSGHPRGRARAVAVTSAHQDQERNAYRPRAAAVPAPLGRQRVDRS